MSNGVLNDVEPQMMILPESIHSIEITDGEIEKLGEALNVKGKHIVINFCSNLELLKG